MGNEENHIREIIVYLVANNRFAVLSLLKRHGIVVQAPGTDKQVVSAVYDGIGNSEAFRHGFKNLIPVNAGGISNKKSIDDFIKCGAIIKSGFANAVEDGPEGWERVETENTDEKSQSGTSSFGNTQVGSFLNTLFTKENINKYIDTGIALAKNKQAIKANQQQIDIAAMQLEQQKLGNAAAAATPAKNNWVLPVIIGSIILVGVIVTVIIVKNKKS